MGYFSSASIGEQNRATYKEIMKENFLKNCKRLSTKEQPELDWLRSVCKVQQPHSPELNPNDNRIDAPSILSLSNILTHYIFKTVAVISVKGGSTAN